MKKIITLTTILLLCFAIFALSACGEEGDDQPSVGVLTAKGFTMDGNVGKISVSNDTEVYSFISQITVQDNATWSISTDLAGKDVIATKTIPLEIGDNTVYLLVSSDDGKEINLYTMTIRRRPMYVVSFQTNGGSYVQSQYVEESSLATEPTTSRTGYTFAGWGFDFSTPITHNTTITALWQAHTNTPYKVEYYLQNLENNEYTLQETKNLTGTTDTTANAEVKTYEHFTFNRSLSTISGNINGSGSLVLKVYYTRDAYAYSVTNQNTKGGSIACTTSGNYKYGTSIDLKATKNTGYDFIGWFVDEKKVSENANYSFRMEQPTAIVAKWYAHENTAYKVKYYLQNLEDDNYTLTDMDNLTGTTDTVANAEIKSYEHFSYNQSASNASGNIDGDGSRVLTAYYTRDKYLIQITAGANATVDNYTNGYYKYQQSVAGTDAVFNNDIGYDLNTSGWYRNGSLYSHNPKLGGFVAVEDVTFVAQCRPKQEMENFIFTSTSTTCSISGVKDKTVTSIIVPDFVTNFEEGAFSGCSSLENLSLPFIGNRKGVTSEDTYQYPLGYLFGTTEYFGGVSTYQPYYGISISNHTYDYYFIPASLRNVMVGAGFIPYGSFYRCNMLISIVFGDSVTSIDKYACFLASSLTTVTVGENISKIGSCAFSHCYRLVEIYNKSSLKIAKGSINLGGIGEYAKDIYTNDYVSKISFYGDGYIIYSAEDSVSLIGYVGMETKLVLPEIITDINQYAFCLNDDIKEIIVCNNIVAIGDGAFRECASLERIVLDKTVLSIGEDVFIFSSSLLDITFNGTVEQWNAVLKGNIRNESNGTRTFLIHCTDGTI